LGWKAKIGLNAGLARVYADFLQHSAEKITWELAFIPIIYRFAAPR
jgi:hypothetical protein